MTPFLFISLFMLTIWVFVLLLSERTRKEQIIMSAIGLVLSPAALSLAASSGWSGLAALSYADLLFSFSLFGIAAVIYQATTGKQSEPIKRRRRKLKNRHLHWLACLLIISGVWLFATLLTSAFFQIYPGQAFIVGGLIIGIYLIADRRDLMVNALFSGLFIAILLFTLEKVFFLKLFPEAGLNQILYGESLGLTVAGVPLGGLAWAAIVGFTVGPLYEYARHWRLK